jgi:hypothetical protein
MSEFRKISEQDQGEWLDEAQAGDLAREVLAAAASGSSGPKLLLHPDGPDLLDAPQDQRGIMIEHWLIMGVWLTTILVSAWQLVF